MSITAKILADSRNPSGSRLTGMIVKFPRFLLPEFNTHRAFSRNAASSRAIPLHKMLLEVANNPALPEYWGAEQKGMQSGEELEPSAIRDVLSSWNDLREEACWTAEDCCGLGLHKSLCNRLIEPWSHITVLVTASDMGFANFFAQRAHPAAQPEFQVLAYRMLSEYIKSEPKELQWGEWHYPVFGEMDFSGANISQADMLKIATARCARLSYLTFDGEHSPEKDIELHDRLLTSGHFSPFEHCAQAISPNAGIMGSFKCYPWSNFDSTEVIENGAVIPVPCGWGQYRKSLKGENQTNVDLAAIMVTKPEWIQL